MFRELGYSPYVQWISFLLKGNGVKMNQIFKYLLLIAPAACICTYIAISGGDVHATDEDGATENIQGYVPDGEASRFPKKLKYLFPIILI